MKIGDGSGSIGEAAAAALPSRAVADDQGDAAAGKPSRGMTSIRLLPQPADGAENPIRLRTEQALVVDLGVVELEHQAGIREHRETDVVIGLIAMSLRIVGIGPEDGIRLQILA